MNNTKTILNLIDEDAFNTLFIEELGWDRPVSTSIPFNIGNEIYELIPVASYRGIQVWACASIPNARVQRDPAFAVALLDEAISLFLNGEPETARLILRDLVNATIGFEELAIATSKPSKSLHRMLSAKGNPTMDNLTAILKVLRKTLQVDIKVQTIACA